MSPRQPMLSFMPKNHDPLHLVSLGDNRISTQALSAWVAQEEERRRLTLEALADVDAGQVIDHQAVQAWAASLDSDKPLPVSP